MYTLIRRDFAVPIAALAMLFALPAIVRAHGTMTHPYSRVYFCAQGNAEDPADPACAAAKQEGGSQAFYDWMSINQAAANGDHRAAVPDGKLCSGNNPTFRGLDLPRSDWQTTPMSAGAYEFRFLATAPHATREWTFYVTHEGWDANAPLRWDELEQFCDLGNTPLSADGTYHLPCTLPTRSGRHVIYATWQRSDSQEAFYTCMDVQFAGGDTGGGGNPAPQWVDAGALSAQTAQPQGTTITLRVFNADGSDAERVDTVLQAGDTDAAAWPARVAETINSQASHARAGVLRNGSFVPVHAATGNRIYLNGSGLRYQLEIHLPEAPGDGHFDYVYPQGIGAYQPGATIVKASDGKLYACRPFPNGAWCNIDADAYRPGTGYAWQDAWTLQ